MPGDTTGPGRWLGDAQQMSLPWARGDEENPRGNPTAELTRAVLWFVLLLRLLAWCP